MLDITDSRQGWLWRLHLPPRLADQLWRNVVRTSRLCDSRYGWLASIACGALPYMALCRLGVSWHQCISSLLVAVLMLPAAISGRWRAAVGFVLLSFAAHNGVAIAHAFYAPEAAALCIPGGAEYWQKQLTWITTGRDPEYLLAAWLPAHLQLLIGASIYAYVSFGWLVLWQGFHEVDIMNYYVGALLHHSASPWIALALGWHPWSLTRGLCYAALVTEVSAWSFSRLVARPHVTQEGRHQRWRWVALLFAADCMLKATLSETVRSALAANLLKG